MKRVPFPQYQNWTLERFQRQFRDAGYFDPWIKPEYLKDVKPMRPKGYGFWDWARLVAAALLILLIAAMYRFWRVM